MAANASWSPLSLDWMADVIAAVLNTLGAAPADVLGVSVGGMLAQTLAQTLALRRPAMGRSLTLVATLCTFPDGARALLREPVRVARVDGMARIAELSIARWFTPDVIARHPGRGPGHFPPFDDPDGFNARPHRPSVRPCPGPVGLP